jgi:hypothetical protein
MVDLVGARQMDDGVVGDRAADRIERTAIGDELIPHRDDSAVEIETDLSFVQLIACVARSQEVLIAVFRPLNRPAKPPSEKRNELVLGVSMAFNSKAATNIRRDAADIRL